jgi:hypothetical protein
MSLVPLAPFILSILSKNKNHAREIAWPCLASFGGITRIRFKGFDRRLCADHLSQAAPPHLFLGQDKTHLSEVNKLEVVARLCQTPVSAVQRYAQQDLLSRHQFAST